MSAEMEHLLKEFEKFQSKIQQAQEQFAGVGQMQDELTELESVATAPDGSIRVVAGPGGAIKDIRLSQEALRQQAGALSANIMATLQRAVAGAARKQAALVESHMGGLGGDITEQVLQAQAEAFGVSIEELREGGEEPAPRPAGELQFDQPVEEPAPRPSAPTPPMRPQTPPAAGPTPQPRPAAPRRRAAEYDDEDEGFGSVFER